MLISGGIEDRPLVQVKSLEKIESDKEAASTAAAPEIPSVASESQLAAHVRLSWNRNKMAREKISLRMLKSLRARRGVYSQAELQAIADRGGLNVVWVDITEEKCKAASAWIREVVTPVDGFPFAFEASPVPELPEAMKNAIVMKAAKEARETMVRIAQNSAPAGQVADPNAPPPAPQGGGQAPGAPMMGPQGTPQQGILSMDEFRAMAVEIGERMRDEVETKYKDAAQKAADKMAKQVQDYMAEGGWKEAIDGFIEDFVTYPAAVMMGPVYQRGDQLKWGAGFKPIVDRSARMTWKWVPVFDCYPSQWATSCQDGDFIVRKRYTRRELFDCIGLEDYREDQIREALTAYTNGHLEGWIWQEAERQRLEQESLYSWLSPRGIIDAIHYWGSVPGWKLMSWGVRGMTDLDPVEEYEVDAILIGPYVIRCAVNRDPLKRRPFFNASFDKQPGSFWGRSVPDLAETPQKMVNAAACSLADNMGWASGPQAWVHVDRLADGENAVEIMPLKVWQLKSDPTQGVNPGVGFFQANSNATELDAIIDKWSIRADDSTGVPRYTYGNERVGGAADTYSGLSMLMNNAAKGLRRSIQQIDFNVIEPSVTAAFVNEMVYGKNMALKADCFVVPKGATAMLVKEARNQAIMTAATVTGNPIDIGIIQAKGRAAILRKVFSEALEISPEGIVPSDQEIEQSTKDQQAAQAAAAQQEAQAAQADAQTRLQLGREQIASQEKMKGAELAAKAKSDSAKSRPVDFEYHPDGTVASATPRAEKPPVEAGVSAP